MWHGYLQEYFLLLNVLKSLNSSLVDYFSRLGPAMGGEKSLKNPKETVAMMETDEFPKMESKTTFVTS